MAQVIMPQRGQKDDALTTIIKGLGIASQIYGIRANMAQLDEYKAKQDQAALEKQQAADLAAGKYNKNQQVKLSENFDISSQQPASGNYQQVTDLETGSPLYVSAKKNNSPLVEKVQTVRNGKKVTLAVDLKTGRELGVWEAQPDEQKMELITTVDAKGTPIQQFVEKQAGRTFPVAPKEPAKVGTRLVTTTGPDGKPVQITVEDKPGQSFPVAHDIDKATQKGDLEANYRYISIKNNAQKLKDLVAKAGTNVIKGPEGAEMDSLIFQMALDHAKLVDPESVAREGEVAAAQKYMLPFRENYGLTTSNSTAKKLIDNYLLDLDARLEARGAAKAGNLNAVTYRPQQDKPDSGTAIAAPSGNGFKMPAPQLTPQDQAAIDFVKNNPNHPDTPGVIQALRKKGL